MMVLGFFQAFEGLAALLNNTLIVKAPNSLWVFNITTWGWIHFLLGLALIATSFSLLRGGLWGRSVGVVLTVISLLANFAYIPIAPIWSIIIMVVDVLILHALITHGSEVRA